MWNVQQNGIICSKFNFFREAHAGEKTWKKYGSFFLITDALWCLPLTWKTNNWNGTLVFRFKVDFQNCFVALFVHWSPGRNCASSDVFTVYHVGRDRFGKMSNTTCTSQLESAEVRNPRAWADFVFGPLRDANSSGYYALATSGASAGARSRGRRCRRRRRRLRAGGERDRTLWRRGTARAHTMDRTTHQSRHTCTYCVILLYTYYCARKQRYIIIYVSLSVPVYNVLAVTRRWRAAVVVVSAAAAAKLTHE